MARAAQRSVAEPLMETLQVDLSAIERGLPIERLNGFADASGFALKDLLDVVIPARTLKHRKARKEPLSMDESDKLALLVRVFDFAVRIWGDRERARYWFQSPKQRFDGRTPMQMMRTAFGAYLVEEMLIQIDEGIFA